MVEVAALYRLSSKKQVARKYEDEVDIPGQKKAIEEFLRTRPDWRLVAQYEEKGVSAFKVSASDRDVLQDAFRDAAAGRWSVLIVFKADRLSRRSLEYPGVLATFHGMNVQVWSVADQPGGKLLSIDNQMDKLVRFVEGWQAETESVNTRIRVSTRHAQLASEGRWVGTRVPYGYQKVPLRDEKGEPVIRNGRVAHQLVPGPEAEVVKEIFARYLAGQSTKAIAAHLNKVGVPSASGKQWRSDSIIYMLQNPFYCGKMPYRYSRPFKKAGVEGIIADGKHEPIITQQQFDDAQAIRKERGKIPLRQRAATHPLAGLLYCSDCGAPMGARVKRHKNAAGEEIEGRWYRCLNHELRGTCPRLSAPAAEIEEAFITTLEEVFTAPTGLRSFLEEQSKAANAAQKAAQVTRRRMQDRLKQIETALKRLDRAYLEAGTIDDAEYAQKKGEYQDERRALEAELARPVATGEARDVGALVDLVKQLRVLWYDEETTPEERKTIALSIVKSWRLKVLVHPDKRVDILPE